jgi:hypothetical protein
LNIRLRSADGREEVIIGAFETGVGTIGAADNEGKETRWIHHTSKILSHGNSLHAGFEKSAVSLFLVQQLGIRNKQPWQVSRKLQQGRVRQRPPRVG